MKDTSQPVHPTAIEHGYNNGVAGMTLLQHYAGQALSGIISNEGFSSPDNMQRTVRCSYMFAEYMLEEYNKRYVGNV